MEPKGRDLVDRTGGESTTRNKGQEVPQEVIPAVRYFKSEVIVYLLSYSSHPRDQVDSPNGDNVNKRTYVKSYPYMLLNRNLKIITVIESM